MAGVASYALARLAVRSGFITYYRYAIIAVAATSMPAMPRSLSVRALEAGELARYEIDAPPAVQADRFAQGMTCLAAFNAQQALVGVTWVGGRNFIEDDVAVRFDLPENSCWDTGLWIAPRFRLGRGFLALWAGTRNWMEARGLHTSYSRIADYNLPSILAHRRLGATVLDHNVFVKIGPWQLSFATRPRLIRIAHGAAALDVRRLVAGR